MTLRLFEGPAGSGKTTRLFKVAAEYLRENALLPDHRVLALTKMHGSRRRMQAMLTKELGRTTLSECATLNSFVLSLVRRWRTLAGTLVDPLPPETSFVALAEVAAALLNNDAVVQWVSACHPLLIVDELQDLRGSELSVVKGLARGLDVLCAADDCASDKGSRTSGCSTRDQGRKAAFEGEQIQYLQCSESKCCRVIHGEQSNLVGRFRSRRPLSCEPRTIPFCVQGSCSAPREALCER